MTILPSSHARTKGHTWRQHAFTLIEIMVVVAIMAIVMGVAIPSIYRRLSPESMQKAVNDILSACEDARATAILQGRTTELVIRPLERQIQTPGFSAHISDKLAIELIDINEEEYKDEEVARVQFHKDGTCDHFRILLHSDHDEYRLIYLEVVTGLADIETDINKIRRYAGSF